MNTVAPNIATPITATADPVTATEVVIKKIRDAWYNGRPIVPIVGAGFSAHSGFPILSSICRYLARMLYALDQCDLLVPKLDGATKLNKQIDKVIAGAREKPIRYLEVFGWPDRFELVQKVAKNILQQAEKSRRKETDHELIEDVINAKYDALARRSCSPRAAISWDKGIGPKAWRQTGEQITPWDRWAIQGDWRRLIQHFTDYEDDYADALFARFGFLHTPGHGHRYLALLVKLLSIRRIFTFNFDDLIEKALTLEGVPFHIFGMEYGRKLPSPAVAEDGLSVIKMHGSHHSILIDERLDRPLRRKYVDRFYELAESDALLLVIGCSGDDRRLEDLLAARRDKPSSGGSPRRAEVCWIHFEKISPVTERIRGTDVAKYENDRDELAIKNQLLRNSCYECPTNNPAAFIRQLLFCICGRYPASSLKYPSHPATPTLFGKLDSSAVLSIKACSHHDYNFQSKLDVKSSEELLNLATACTNNGFITIWVDIEAVQSLEGVVGAIIDGCRNIDPDLPPAVMPLGDWDQGEPTALERLQHALQRQRYAVLIDAVGTYGASPLMHHSAPEEHDGERLVTTLKRLPAKLSTMNLGQSIIIASLEGHAPRRLEKDLDERDLRLMWQPGSLPGHPLLWTCMATMRRTRALPSLRRLLAPMIPGGLADESKVDQFLRDAAKVQNSPLRPLEGGDFWFDREKRNEVYNYATRFSGKKFFRDLEKGKKTLRAPSQAQCMLMAFIQRKIASTYFSFEFLQSKDAASFLEYTYHRISSIRYFSRLIYLIASYGIEEIDNGPGVLKTIEREMPIQSETQFSATDYFTPLWANISGILVNATRDTGSMLVGSAASDILLRELDIRRASELYALLASWKEFEQEVRSQIPAEQLLHWSEQILGGRGHGLTRMYGVYVATENPAVSQFVAHNENNSQSKKLCDQLREYLLRLNFRIHLERGDYKSAQETHKEMSVAVQKSLKGRLDHAELLVRRSEIEAARDALINMETEATGPSSIQSEDRHRYFHISCLTYLGGRPWVISGIKNGRLLAASKIKLDEALNHAEQGLNGLRGAGALLAPPLDGVMVSAGSAGGAYLPYRSVFRTLKGRAIVGKLLTTDIATVQMMDDFASFRRAMKQFDSAKGGLDTRYILLKCWADLHSAEACLLLARRTFDRKPGDKEYEGRLTGGILSKLLSCRTHLQNSIYELRVGRRNALWWQQCYQLVAQYHIERLMHNLCVLREEKTKALGADVFRRFGKGLNTVASFADYALRREDAFSGHDGWLKRSVAEITLGATVAVAYFESEGKMDVSTFESIRREVTKHASQHYGRAFDSHGNVARYLDEVADCAKELWSQCTFDNARQLRNLVVRAARLERQWDN